MKSKTFCFNKTIFKKNVSLFWPIWMCFLLIELIKGPVYLWFCFKKFRGGKLELLFGEINLTIDLILMAVAAVIVGMALFNYLFVPKNANMIHALPVTRPELFWTNLVSGYTFLFVPQVIVFFISVILCLSHGVAEVQYLGIWLLLNMGMGFFFFSVVVLCAMFTGQIFALPVYFVVTNVLVEGISVGLSCLVNMMAYGVSNNPLEEGRFCFLSPFIYLYKHLKMTGTFQVINNRGDYELTKITVVGHEAVMVYAIVAVCLYILAFACYQKRDIEDAGDVITFSWFKPTFRWLAGAGLGFVMGTVLMNFLRDMKQGTSVLVWIVLILFFGTVGFFFAEMLIDKSIRVLNKRRIIECLGFYVAVLLVFGSTYLYSYRESNGIPNAADVQYAYVDMNYPVEFEGDAIEDVIFLQKNILEKKERIRNELEKNEMNNGSGHVTITYLMKDGSNITRSYLLPSGASVSAKMFDQINEWEAVGNNFLRQYVEYGYQEVSNITEAQVEWYDHEIDFYSSHSTEGEEAKIIYDAMVKDAMEGNIQKYNLVDYQLTWDERVVEPAAYLYIYFNHPKENWQSMYDRVNGIKEKSSYIMDENSNVYLDAVQNSLGGGIYVSFGEDCTNIVQALVECGLIDSSDEIQYMAEPIN